MNGRESGRSGDGRLFEMANSCLNGREREWGRGGAFFRVRPNSSLNERKWGVGVGAYSQR